MDCDTFRASYNQYLAKGQIYNGNDYCFQSEPRREGTNLIRTIYFITHDPIRKPIVK
jgi:hypothetical protein